MRKNLIAIALTLLATSLTESLSLSFLSLPAQALETRGPTKSDEARKLYEGAKLKSASGDYIGANQDLTRAIAIDPNYGQAYANRSASRFNLADYRGAIEDVDKALKYFPDMQSLLEIKSRAVAAMNEQAQNQQNQKNGSTQAQQNDLAQRQALARQLLLNATIGGGFADPSTMLLMQQAQRVAAARNASRQAPVNNDSAAVVSGKDNPFGGHADSKSPFSGASSSNSPFGGAAGNGNSPFDGGNGGEAATTATNSAAATGSTNVGSNPFAAASSSSPTAKDYFQKGCEHNKAQDFVGAIEFFNQAIALDSTNGDAYANRGLARFHVMNFKGALEDFEAADKLIPNNKELKHYIEICKQAAK